MLTPYKEGKAEIADVFDDMADLLEVDQANPFRVPVVTRRAAFVR